MTARPPGGMNPLGGAPGADLWAQARGLPADLEESPGAGVSGAAPVPSGIPHDTGVSGARVARSGTVQGTTNGMLVVGFAGARVGLGPSLGGGPAGGGSPLPGCRSSALLSGCGGLRLAGADLPATGADWLLVAGGRQEQSNDGALLGTVKDR